ncbi:hypothetical protein BGX38DRAFT_179713 [Terfezia claveryi]|nr:hypothetical protein BGX38DRAFT_179713 [Terfezia claveryi]
MEGRGKRRQPGLKSGNGMEDRGSPYRRPLGASPRLVDRTGDGGVWQGEGRTGMGHQQGSYASYHQIPGRGGRRRSLEGVGKGKCGNEDQVGKQGAGQDGQI